MKNPSLAFLMVGSSLLLTDPVLAQGDSCFDPPSVQTFRVYYHNSGNTQSCPNCIRDFDMDFPEFLAFLDEPQFLPFLAAAAKPRLVVDFFGPCGGSEIAHGALAREYFEFACRRGVTQSVVTSGSWASTIAGTAAAGAGTVVNASNFPDAGFDMEDIDAIETCYQSGVLLVIPGAIVFPQAELLLGQKKLGLAWMNGAGNYVLPNFDPTDYPTNRAVVTVATNVGTGPTNLIARTFDVPPGVTNGLGDTGSFSSPLLAGTVALIADIAYSRNLTEPYTIEKVLDYVISSCDRPPSGNFSFRTNETLPSLAPWSDIYAYGIYSPWKALIYAYGFGILDARDSDFDGVPNPPTIFSDHFELRGDLLVPEQQEFVVSALGSINVVTPSPEGPNLGLVASRHEIRVEGTMSIASPVPVGVNASILVDDEGSCTVDAGGLVKIDAGMVLDVAGTLVVNGTVDISDAGTVHFKPGSSVTVEAGGQFRIDAGAVVQIDDGSIVEVLTGGTILTESAEPGTFPEDWTIDVQGVLEVEDGAILDLGEGTTFHSSPGSELVVRGEADLRGQAFVEGQLYALEGSSLAVHGLLRQTGDISLLGTITTFTGATVHAGPHTAMILATDVSIAAGALLRIDEDVTVTIGEDANAGGADPTRVEVSSAGRMQVVGTSSLPVTFESELGGTSRWVGIKHTSTGAEATVLEHVALSDAVLGLDFGGTSPLQLSNLTVSICATGMKFSNRIGSVSDSDLFSCTTGIEFASANILLDGVSVHGTHTGLKCTNSDPIVRNSKIYSNYWGVHTLDAGAVPDLGTDQSFGNNNFGITPLNTKHIVATDPENDILAQNNWWGTTNVAGIMNRIVVFDSDLPHAGVVIAPVLTQAPSYLFQVGGGRKPGREPDAAAPTLAASAQKPLRFELLQNVPNPFNPTTRIGFTLERSGWTSLAVHDVNGSLIRTLVDERLPAGNHWCDWDGRNARGEPLSSGVYFYRLKTEKATLTRKAILLK